MGAIADLIKNSPIRNNKKFYLNENPDEGSSYIPHLCLRDQWDNRDGCPRLKGGCPHQYESNARMCSSQDKRNQIQSLEAEGKLDELN